MCIIYLIGFQVLHHFVCRPFTRRTFIYNGKQAWELELENAKDLGED